MTGGLARTWLCELAALAIVAVLSAMIVPIVGTDVTGNSAGYLIQARQISAGEAGGNTLESRGAMARGPMFPLLLALGFRAGPPTVQTAVTVTRIFFAASVLLTYAVARMLGGRAAGVVAALLVLTSFGLNQIATYIDTDTVLPAFMLGFLLLYGSALRIAGRPPDAQRSAAPAVALAAGLVLGLAILVKETGWLLLGVPVLIPLLVRADERRGAIRCGVAVIAGSLLCIAPWLVWMLTEYGSLAPALGVATAGSQSSELVSSGGTSVLLTWARIATVNLPRIVADFYVRYLTAMTVLAPLLAAGWAYGLWRAVRGRTGTSLVPVVAFLCYTPIVLWVVQFGYRPGQLTFLVLLSYAMAGVAIAGCVTALAAGTAVSRVRSAVIAVVVILIGSGLSAAQLFANVPPSEPTWRAWTSESRGLALLTRRPFRATSRITNEQEAAARWLETHAPGAIVGADGGARDAMRFFLRRRDVPSFSPFTELALRSASLPERQSRPVFVLTSARIRETSPIVFLVFQEQVLAQLRDVDYLVVSRIRSYIRPYLDRVRWASLVSEHGDTAIYRVDHKSPLFVSKELGPAPPRVRVRSGDGTVVILALEEDYRLYEVPGSLRSFDHMHMFLDRPGELFLDDVSFVVPYPGGTNLLMAADSGFEQPEIHWQGLGAYTVARAAGEAAHTGRYGLAVSGPVTGSGGNQLVLQVSHYKDPGGRTNQLSFYAKGRASGDGFLCINDRFAEDVEWLRANEPPALAALERALESWNVPLARAVTTSCRLPSRTSP